MKSVLKFLTLWFLMVNSSSVGIAADNSTGSIKPTDKINHGAMNGDKAQAEIQRIDNIEGKITLKHGPLKKLNMPGMTMEFKVRDPVMLSHLKKGDKVDFTVENVNGELIVTGIEEVK